MTYNLDIESTRLVAHFNTFVIDLNVIAQAVQKMIAEVSKLHMISPQELTIHKGPNGETPTTIDQALENGTKPIDAIIWALCKNWDPTAMKDFVPLPNDSLKESRAADGRRQLLKLYLFIMFRGSNPGISKSANPVPMPAFILRTFQTDESESDFSSALSSFPISKLDPAWVQYVNVDDFHTSVKSRMTLGLPGYRWINAMKITPLSPTVQNNGKKLYEWVIRNFSEYYWDVFPPTRTTEFSAKFPTFSKSLEDFLSTVWDQKTVDRLKEKKVIFDAPKEDIRYRSWTNWADHGDLKLTKPMFKKSRPTAPGYDPESVRSSLI